MTSNKWHYYCEPQPEIGEMSSPVTHSSPENHYDRGSDHELRSNLNGQQISSLKSYHERDSAANFTDNDIGFSSVSSDGKDSEIDLDTACPLFSSSESNYGSDSDTDKGLESIVHGLKRIKRDYNISMRAIGAVAAHFRAHGHDIPKDARTILGTPRAPVDDKSFIHLGLLEGLLQVISTTPVNSLSLDLKINIDGLPLSKSSSVNFWPILCLISKAKPHPPFVISLYCGRGKPPDLESYLCHFINEYISIKDNGFTSNGNNYSIKLKSAICDAPARSFLKCTKGHNGKGGCERCSQRGESINRRWVYPEFDALRTDLTFRSGEHEDHRTGLSPFEAIDELDMNFDFPLDPMHMLYLGVMKRMLKNIWLGKKFPHRFSDQQIKTVNVDLLSLRSFWPVEFNRKGRILQNVPNWKAVEFRDFLLYLGPLVLKKLLSDEKLEHFLHFHVAARILATPSSNNDQKSFAGSLLRYFVFDFGRIYG